ncbi:MAG TPA: hypothetical protein VF765_20750 [Polyangiaceae bacterium]
MNPTSKTPGSPEAELTEAQAKLMEAEAKLLDRSARTAGSDPNESHPQPVTTARESRPTIPEPAREHAPAKPGAEKLPENVAGMLCYLLGWVSGLIFLLVDRRPFVRFHAAQSVAVFATLSILLLALGDFFLGAIFPHHAGVLLVLRRLLWLVWLASAVVLMLKAAGGERVRVRFASQYADRAAHGH